MSDLTDVWGRCPVCGEHGACAVDAEGEPMRHVAPNEDDFI